MLSHTRRQFFGLVASVAALIGFAQGGTAAPADDKPAHLTRVRFKKRGHAILVANGPEIMGDEPFEESEGVKYCQDIYYRFKTAWIAQKDALSVQDETTIIWGEVEVVEQLRVQKNGKNRLYYEIQESDFTKQEEAVYFHPEVQSNSTIARIVQKFQEWKK